MSDEKIVIDEFGMMEQDAIGEIMNITMGSAATAVSNMLYAKVWITTPTVSIIKAKSLSFPELEPSIVVRIKYTKGISGHNVLVLKQNDVQMILNQLMGLPLELSDDFQFDEMNISAVCEVMNQMMGASATALSEILDMPVDISTPEAIVQEDPNATIDRLAGLEVGDDEYACTVKFNLTIDGVIQSEFMSVLTLDLAKEMAGKMMSGYAADDEPEPAPAPPPPAPAPAAQPMPAAAQPQPMMPPPAAPYPQPMPYDPNMAAPPPMYPQPYPMPPQGMPMPMQMPVQMNMQPVQLQSFGAYTNPSLNQGQNDNLQLLMSVPLNVSVEIGSTTKKVKDILDFAQGTIIELERQAGAPVDIVVNGNLVAKGDVVVIDDNFAVRITEIIKSKFLDNLGKE
ncbi:MAG: flagellar motor switch phosphatase FliY [Oscillospiraceae bacterium]|nr:flagellar motor switch phosphatase FliY [Oscillospiraceae bacterium]